MVFIKSFSQKKGNLLLEKQKQYYFGMKIGYIYWNGLRKQNIMKM